ncbi:class A sortase [Lactiplantibacillus plantarum]|uniref:class A sortase n=1 Tax=Lactiplantibacillus plantarum TaxID=1590 RepID=UPI001BAC5D9B|nr:class A sortase [Lactiplantibacillus plantarum]MBS0955439.1 class A sortase [Lactiplantibacillus plantarum]
MRSHFRKKHCVRWLAIATALLLMVGGYGWFCHWQNQRLINRPVTSQATTVTTRATLRTDKVKPFTQQEFLHYRQAAFKHKVNEYPTGYLIIKRAGIRLPIYARANNYTLALGVSKSFYLDSQMGQGNYVLAGHNMEQPGVLLTNLAQTKIDDQMIITNRHYGYRYRVTTKQTVNPNVTLVNGRAAKGSALYLPTAKEKPLLTVYTCANGGANRLMVQGQLINRFKK